MNIHRVLGDLVTTARIPDLQHRFAGHGIVVERVLTDNGSCYRSRPFAAALGDTVHSRTRPYLPANGKVERFNRTLLAEWAYARAWSSDGPRTGR